MRLRRDRAPHAAALLHAQAISVTAGTPMVTSVLHAMIGLLPETGREIDAGNSPHQPGSKKPHDGHGSAQHHPEQP